MEKPLESGRYDAIIIGGAFSGSVFSTLLKRWNPDARVLIVERSEAFDRKVGEATVEISSLMLHRILGLHDYLAREHLPKHGLRYWFSRRRDQSLGEISEVGPLEVPRLPAFQLDRSKMDQKLLDGAVKAGAELLRPARVVDLDLGWPQSRVTVELEGEAGTERRELTARWVIDASGRQALIARKKRILKRTEEHPTAAVWGRFRGVADFDGVGILGTDPRRPSFQPIPAARRLATNHFCGYGYWCWMIPLAGGETSIGLVYNKELFELPEGRDLKERFLAFLAAEPGLRELTADAELDPEDFRSYAHLPYCTEQYMDRGWASLGDAASFMDPFYSPGLDHASISAFATARVVEDDLAGRWSDAELGEAVAVHNDAFQRSYRRWITALYVGKYELMGDAELTGASFLMDTAMYYMGCVTPIHEDVEMMRWPLFGQPIWQTTAAYNFMHFYHRRLVSLARARRRLGTYGRRNEGWRHLVRTAGLGRTGATDMFKEGFKLWMKSELSTFWRRITGGRGDAPESPRVSPRKSAPASDGGRDDIPSESLPTAADARA